MSFLRIKKIKGNEYAYVAENTWMKRSSKVRQSTKKYLGRVVRLKPAQELEFFSFHGIKEDEIEKYLENSTKEELIYDSIEWELAKHGFELSKSSWKKDDMAINLKLHKVAKGSSSLALGINDGYLSSYTMSRLIRFKAYAEEDAYVYAKLFVEAGLNLPKTVFVAIFNKHNIDEFANEEDLLEDQ